VRNRRSDMTARSAPRPLAGGDWEGRWKLERARVQGRRMPCRPRTMQVQSGRQSHGPEKERNQGRGLREDPSASRANQTSAAPAAFRIAKPPPRPSFIGL
jgi:hypothetical protein